MSFGLRENRKLARRRRRRRLLKWIFVLAVLAGLGVAGFQSGSRLSEQELRQARRELDRLASASAALKRENAELKTAAETARLRETELQRRYDADVPGGHVQTLMALVTEQLEKGAEVERLRFLISAAGHQERCDGEPVTKRFIVRTPLYDGANAAVTFAEGALTVAAKGEPAQDEQGRVQAWFDPSQPIALEIARLGREPGHVAGILPLHHALVVNGDEYRMSIVPGERRGFVEITADRCRLP